jgi:hypothetical protein
MLIEIAYFDRKAESKSQIHHHRRREQSDVGNGFGLRPRKEARLEKSKRNRRENYRRRPFCFALYMGMSGDEFKVRIRGRGIDRDYLLGKRGVRT